MPEIPIKGLVGVADDVLPMARSAMRPAEQKTDIVDDIEGQLFSMKVQLPIFVAPMALGGMASLGTRFNMPWLANGASKLQNLTFSELGNATGLGSAFGAVSNGVMKTLGVAAKPIEFLGLHKIPMAHYAQKARVNEMEIQNALGIISQHAEHAAGTELGTALQHVHAHASSGLQSLHFEPMGKSMAMAETALSKVHSPGMLSFIGFGSKGSMGGQQVAKALSSLKSNATHLEVNSTFARGYGKFSESISGATPKMANAGVWHGALMGTFLAGAAASDYHTIKDLRKGLHALKDMYCGLTGEKQDDISVFSLFLGKVPQPVAAARVELLKEFGPAVVLDAANTVLNIKCVASHKFNALGKNLFLFLALPMANMVIARGFLGGTLLPAYMKVKEAENAHQPVTQEDYIHLIGNASKELQKLGGENSNFTKALAFFYAQHQAKADTVMKEIDNGMLQKRMAEMERTYNAYIHEHPEHAPKNHAKTNGHATAHPAAHAHVANGHNHAEHNGNGVSHAERVHGARPERKVIGPQTERLIERAVAHGERESPVI